MIWFFMIVWDLPSSPPHTSSLWQNETWKLFEIVYFLFMFFVLLELWFFLLSSLPLSTLLNLVLDWFPCKSSRSPTVWFLIVISIENLWSLPSSPFPPLLYLKKEVKLHLFEISVVISTKATTLPLALLTSLQKYLGGSFILA